MARLDGGCSIITGAKMNKAKRIFLIYAREDKHTVDKVYLALKGFDLAPWMDEPPPPHEKKGLSPGQLWNETIRSQLDTAMLVLAFFSRKSVEKDGFVQREYRLALDRLAEKPSEEIFLIPVLIEECVPPRLRIDTVSYDRLQWFRLYQDSVGGLASYVAKVVRSNLWRTLKPGRRIRGEVASPLSLAVPRASPPDFLPFQLAREGGAPKDARQARVDRSTISQDYVLGLMRSDFQSALEDLDEDEPKLIEWGAGTLDGYLSDQLRSVKFLSPVAGVWRRSEAGDRYGLPIDVGAILGEIRASTGEEVSILAPSAGCITRFLAEDGESVETGQALYLFWEHDET